jgi:ABC-2 type transport system ATP-binding protein
MPDTGHASVEPSDALVVETRDLVRTFAEQHALDGLSLTVERGECIGLLGPNGAGKTTTIRILATACTPTSGFVRVLGRDPTREAAEIRARIGVVPQEIALYDSLSARENLEFFGRLQGLRDERLRARVDWALREAGLADRADDRVAAYSGGMKRRLNIVAALLHEPELVFLDEPTVGIDPQSRLHVFEMVEAMRAAGIALVYTTHQLGEVERLCDRIVILDHGRVVAQGTLAELQGIGGVARRKWARFAMEPGAGGAVELLAERGIACEIEEESAGLEEIFLGLTGRALRDEP